MNILDLNVELAEAIENGMKLLKEDPRAFTASVYVCIDSDGDITEKKVQAVSLIRDGDRFYLCFNCPEK